LPHAVDHFSRQAVAELAGDEDQLTAMVRFVCDEVV
jgi:hypothetical protein